MAAAGAMDLDSVLDDDELAYDLQLEEAIAASLNLLPSTSHSPPPSTSSLRPSPFLNDDCESLDAIMLLDNDALEDAVEMDRRLHHIVAGDVINISDDDWEDYDLGLPYAMDVSAISMSLNPLFDIECFRLYFKGLVSEESVGDVTAIAVAVFDPSGNLLIEVRKPLEAVRESGTISHEVAELMALIEGLEAALALSVERVSFFCDDFRLYQYVTDRLRPRRSKVASLVDNVALLRGQFTSCEPVFVEQNDVKFAFKLAKEATASRISKSKPLLENCKICYEDNELGQMFTVDGCLHRYCFSCMKKHVEVKFLGGTEAKCPHEGCESTVSVESCDELLPPDVIEIIRQRAKESSIPFSEKVYCPRPRCSTLMSKTEVLEYTKDIHGNNDEQSGARKCIKCHELFCIKCKTPWHNGMTCEDYRKSSHNAQTEDAKLSSLAKEKLWRPCARCCHLVELAEGCFHIICRCGYEFCYSCGAGWENKQPTCSCPRWAEQNIINGAL